jgi:ribosomal protein S21
MVNVKVADFGTLEKALKRFKQEAATNLREARKRSRYEKPSDARRRALKKAIQRARRKTHT